MCPADIPCSQHNRLLHPCSFRAAYGIIAHDKVQRERRNPMATIEERLTALEQENAALKKTVELQMIALRALVTKDAFEALRETNNKIFDVLMSHDQLTNERLGDLQTQVVGLDGKIVGLQTEARQRFDQQGKLLLQILDRLPPS
jgi:hypothetical protein